MSSYGSESLGAVSMGTASTAFTGQRSQPREVARQPFSVNDSALSGHSTLPGHFTRLPYMGIPPWKWKWGRPPRLPGYAGPKEHFSSGYFSPVRGPAFSPGIHRHPYGVRGIFRVGANASHQAGTAPPLWWN